MMSMEHNTSDSQKQTQCMVVQFPNKTLRESSPNRQPLYLLMILVRNVTTESYLIQEENVCLFKQFIRELTNRKFYDNEAALIVGS